MEDAERFYPKTENLGQDCRFWCLGGIATGCCFPSANLNGRRSCEGVIDDVCLFIKDGRRPDSLTDQQISDLKNMTPDLIDKSHLPPGDVV